MSSRLISVTERLLTAELQKGLLKNKLGITVEQWRILFYLWKEDGINQQELAKRSSKEKSTITRQIDALEQKGFIIRKSADHDKRNKLIYLTKKGASIEELALSTASNITLKAEQGLTSNEVELLKKILRKIIDNLNS